MTVSTVSPERLRDLNGFLVADVHGRLVGRVECPMVGREEGVPDALAVKAGLFGRRRKLVPASTVTGIDEGSGVVSLAVERETIRRFL